MELLIKTVIGAIGGILGFLFGGFDVLLLAVTILVIADFLSGIMAGFYMQTLSSKIGFKGIIKKVMLFLLIVVAALVDEVLGLQAMFREAVLFFILANELISILENAGKMGIEIPMLSNAVSLIKNKSENNNHM